MLNGPRLTPATAEFASPCSPASVFCSQRSCCRRRYWFLGWARRHCCARLTRNLSAIRRGTPSPRPWLRSKAKPVDPCWRCCVSNRRLRSRRRPAILLQLFQPRLPPSQTELPSLRRPLSPNRLPRQSRKKQLRLRPQSPRSRSSKVRYKARRPCLRRLTPPLTKQGPRHPPTLTTPRSCQSGRQPA